DGRANQFFHLTNVFYRLCRQVRPFARSDGRFLPAFQRDIDRLDTGLCGLACRQVVDILAVQLVADADLQFVETVEDVELGQRDAGNAVGGDRLAHRRRVEPAAAALAARDRAEFMALLAEELA